MIENKPKRNCENTLQKFFQESPGFHQDVPRFQIRDSQRKL